MNASGESYALPVRLVAKQGSIDVMPVTGSLVILANSIMEFSAPQFVGSTELVAKNSLKLLKPTTSLLSKFVSR